MDIMTVFPRRPSLENVQRVDAYNVKGPYRHIKIVITQVVIEEF